MNDYLKSQIQKYYVYSRAADKADSEMLADPTNAEKEAAFDKAYKKEYTQYILTAKLIVEYTGGKIDFDTAKKMLCTKELELLQILERI